MGIESINSIISDLNNYCSLDLDSVSKDDSKLTGVFSQLEGIIESSQNCRNLLIIKDHLKLLESELSGDKYNSQSLVARKLSTVASTHLHVLTTDYQKKRDEVLENIPDAVVSLRGIDLNTIKGTGSFLEPIIEGAMEIEDFIASGGVCTGEDPWSFDIKLFLGNTNVIPTLQLPEAVDMAKDLIALLEDEVNVSDFVQSCARDPSRVKILFSIVHVLGLDAFQEKHLEPFNKIFPSIPLDQVPKTVH